jgi:hypothetical protein
VLLGLPDLAQVTGWSLADPEKEARLAGRVAAVDP